MDLVAGSERCLFGTLRVEGTMCRRLEDAYPVAATTFRECGRRQGVAALCHHDQAAGLWLECAGLPIRLRGPVVVRRGSVERVVGWLGLSHLCSRAHERIAAAEISTETPSGSQEAVFRSLGSGDEVFVVGRVARATAADGPASYRRSGMGYELVAADEGVILVSSVAAPRVSSLRPRRRRSSRQLRRILGLRV